MQVFQPQSGLSFLSVPTIQFLSLLLLLWDFSVVLSERVEIILKHIDRPRFGILVFFHIILILISKSFGQYSVVRIALINHPIDL